MKVHLRNEVMSTQLVSIGVKAYKLIHNNPVSI